MFYPFGPCFLFWFRKGTYCFISILFYFHAVFSSDCSFISLPDLPVVTSRPPPSSSWSQTYKQKSLPVCTKWKMNSWHSHSPFPFRLKKDNWWAFNSWSHQFRSRVWIPSPQLFHLCCVLHSPAINVYNGINWLSKRCLSPFNSSCLHVCYIPKEQKLLI